MASAVEMGLMLPGRVRGVEVRAGQAGEPPIFGDTGCK
jgi:hypothetical protein